MFACFEEASVAAPPSPTQNGAHALLSPCTSTGKLAGMELQEMQRFKSKALHVDVKYPC